MECLYQSRRFAEQTIRPLIIGLVATAAVLGCKPHHSEIATLPPPGAAGGQTQPAIRFVDVGQAAGLTQPTWCGRPEKPHLFESGGYGLALFDYDNDGALDL